MIDIHVPHCGDMSITGSILQANIDALLAEDDNWKSHNYRVIVHNVVSDRVDLNRDIRQARSLLRSDLTIIFKNSSLE